ncbi:hypothetical protein H2204_005284 [Knufia peltigerae]|uniref:SnoaL-like domain-containing protein n=1 Tax=Knufia peltigerae TaxID=1002370 RepID=A0AA38Y742_9EURO|nr:hypothetical protein H2204_005284 [Knufia peltigerae]
MGYNTELTEWPSTSVPQPAKLLVDKLFAVLDSKAPEAGDTLADEVFTKDGCLDSHHRFEGADAIRRSRINAWMTLTSRRHEVLKVYTDSYEGDDLLLIGQLTAGFASGELKRGEFIARIRLSQSLSAMPRIKSYKVWMDASAMKTVDETNYASFSGTAPESGVMLRMLPTLTEMNKDLNLENTTAP